jgi:hypothetical protein
MVTVPPIAMIRAAASKCSASVDVEDAHGVEVRADHG